MHFAIQKLVILVPTSCDFDKREENWPEKYQMKDVDLEINNLGPDVYLEVKYLYFMKICSGN